jgi:hypothetical protein
VQAARIARLSFDNGGVGGVPGLLAHQAAFGGNGLGL